jgi:hypothetical protein
VVLDHFTEKSFHRIFLTERHLTETPFDRTPFDRKFILPKKVIWPKTKFIKRSLDRNFLEKGHYCSWKKYIKKWLKFSLKNRSAEMG